MQASHSNAGMPALYDPLTARCVPRQIRLYWIVLPYPACQKPTVIAMSAVLIATLGAEPQVVSLATYLLLAQHVPLRAVFVLHTDASHPPIGQALPLLCDAFAAQPSWPPLHTVPVQAVDALTPQELDCFGEMFFQTLQSQLTQGRQIHLLLAGGRKSMAMVGMSVAQLLLGPHDAIWHLYSDDTLRHSGRMTPTAGDQVQLVAVPLPHPAMASPQFTPTAQAPTRAAALATVEALRARQAQQFIASILTPAERDLAVLVAREVLTAEEMAARLHKSPKTITNQLTTIYSKLESAFGLQPDRGVKREFLRQELGPYLAALAPQT